MEVPQTISQAPAGFGTLEGHYLVPDGGFGLDGPFRIWAVPADGGAPTAFVDTDDLFPDDGLPRTGLRGGLFLPTAFGGVGARYVTAAVAIGRDAANDFHVHSRIVTVDGSGNVEDFVRFDFVGDINDYPMTSFQTCLQRLHCSQTCGHFVRQLIYALFGVSIACAEQGELSEVFEKRTQFPFGSESCPDDGGRFAPLISERTPKLLLSDLSLKSTT